MKEAIKTILSDKDNREGMHVQQIADTIILKFAEIAEPMTRDQLVAKINAFLLKESRVKKGNFVKVVNPKTKKAKKGVYRFVKRKLEDPLPEPIKEPEEQTEKTTTKVPQSSVSTNYIGKGGEHAVMSELLFRGYNANIMTVDEGIDIVASKQNVFYYLQVKTTNLSERYTANVNIKRSSFDRGLTSQLRYFVVVRCESGDTRYFKFSEEDIIRYNSQGYILMTDELIHIKIKFGIEDHLPYLYHDGKQTEIRYHQNNFNL